MPSLDLSASTLRTCFRPVLVREPAAASTLLSASSPHFVSLLNGARIEVSAASFQTAPKLGSLVSQGAGGSALVVDYGADHAVGNSFHVCPLQLKGGVCQLTFFHHLLPHAFKGHALADPFDCPGQADLAANGRLCLPSRGAALVRLSFSP